MPRRKLTVLRKPLNTDVTIAARAIRARIHYARPCIQFESSQISLIEKRE